MSDTMLLGILRMPFPDNPDPLTLAQLAWRAGQAADRIEHDATEINRLRAENETLRAFARDVMAEWPDGDVDGGALQEMAVAHGLLVPETRTAYCGDDCDCAEYYTPEDMADGVTCYRRAPLLSEQTPPSCAYCRGSGEVEADNNGPIGPCPVCGGSGENA